MQRADWQSTLAWGRMPTSWRSVKRFFSRIRLHCLIGIGIGAVRVAQKDELFDFEVPTPSRESGPSL